MGCINYGTTPIEVENVEKQKQAKEQANLDTEKQEPCDDPGLLGESLDPGLLGESLKES